MIFLLACHLQIAGSQRAMTPGLRGPGVSTIARVSGFDEARWKRDPWRNQALSSVIPRGDFSA
jgi:hypothetical protein